MDRKSEFLEPSAISPVFGPKGPILEAARLRREAETRPKDYPGGLEDFAVYVGQRYQGNAQLTSELEGLPLFRGDFAVPDNVAAFESLFKKHQLDDDLFSVYEGFYNNKFEDIHQRSQKGEMISPLYVSMHYLQQLRSHHQSRQLSETEGEGLSEGAVRGIWLMKQLSHQIEADIKAANPTHSLSMIQTLSLLSTHFGVDSEKVMSTIAGRYSGAIGEFLGKKLTESFLKSTHPNGEAHSRANEYLLERDQIDLITEINGERVAADIKKDHDLKLPTPTVRFCDVRMRTEQVYQNADMVLVPLQTFTTASHRVPFIVIRFIDREESGTQYETVLIRDQGGQAAFETKPLQVTKVSNTDVRSPNTWQIHRSFERSFAIFKRTFPIYDAKSGLGIVIGGERRRDTNLSIEDYLAKQLDDARQIRQFLASQTLASHQMAGAL